jgi:hypothetical protein
VLDRVAEGVIVIVSFADPVVVREEVTVDEPLAVGVDVRELVIVFVSPAEEVPLGV